MLHVHRAERADGLVAALGDLLAEPLADPFKSEVVAVPTRGMERWLSQQLSARLGTSASGRDGVCANVLFPSPRRLIADALAAASGVDPETDPWLPERSVWTLLAAVEDCLHQPWLAELAAHLGADSDPPDPVRGARRLSAVRHLAALFDRYAVHRPEEVLEWTRADTAPAGAAAWQSQLWRALSERIDLPGPAERLQPACARLQAEPTVIDLPARLSLFGLTRLVRSDLYVLRALAAARDVHLFLLHPSPELWRRVSTIPKPTPKAGLPRREDPTAAVAQNPLLASWGRDVREMQLTLQAPEAPIADHHYPLSLEPTSLLKRIQADVITDRAPPGEPLTGSADARPQLEVDDRSIQVHACHGRARQVEVLREAILHLLAEDPTLEPRDVIVMCPDIETFAPLITATFGANDPQAARDGEGAPPVPELRVRLADRSLRQTNPLLAVVAELLALVDGRLSASQVLDLAEREPVRRRFRFDDDDLARLQEWVSSTGIRWGLDPEQRAAFGLRGLRAGTWSAGIERVLLGAAMTEDGDRLIAGRLPLDDVGSDAIELAGRCAELITRLRQAVDALSRRQPIAAWATAITDAADALAVPPPRQPWQRAELQRVLDDLVAEARDDHTSDLTLPEVRALLADRLAGRPTRANFRTGHLTICTLYPMRSVPHRVVCLLGLDDGAFPRKPPRDGDDLMLRNPHVGERDPRSEDRQLLLDAVLAARERLLITYSAADERTNVRLPPAVPVGELLDTIDATVRLPDGRAREQVEVRHPLQPFDTRNFVADRIVPGSTWSFDPIALAGAQALNSPRIDPGAFLSAPLPPPQEAIVELEDVVRFVQRPVRSFLRRRLRLLAPQEDEEIADGLPLELGGLERWQVGQRLLDARLAGVADRAACLAEIARGTLPPGALGEPVIRDLYPVVDAILTTAAELAPDAEPRPLDIQLPLADGRRLSGTVAGARDDTLLTTTFSRIGPRQRLSAWVRLVAATAAHPHLPLTAVTIGRSDTRTGIRAAIIAPLGGDERERARGAHRELDLLLDLFDRGMREPLPLYASTSAAYVQAATAGEDAMAAARSQWESEWQHRGEDAEREHLLVLGGVRRFSDLLKSRPAPGEAGPGWDAAEATRFGRLARRLWDGLLAHEQVRDAA